MYEFMKISFEKYITIKNIVCKGSFFHIIMGNTEKIENYIKSQFCTVWMQFMDLFNVNIWF